jgi:homoserine dehydrogenase
MKPIQVGLMGIGTVGAGVHVLRRNRRRFPSPGAASS